MKKHTTKALFFIVIAAIAGGSVPVAAKFALEVFKPFTVVALRFFFASLVLLPLVYKANELNSRTLKGLFTTAFIGAFNPILLFIALQFTRASFSPLIYACVPALTALYLYLFRNKSISSRQLVGIVVGFIGVFAIVLLPALQSGVEGVSIWANVLIICAAVAFVIYGVWSKEKQKELHFSPLALTFYFSLVTLLISIPFMTWELVGTGIPSNVSALHLLSGVYAGVVGTGVFYLAFQYALKHGTAVTASLFTYVQPIAGISLAALLLGDEITLPFIVGGTLALVGAHIASKQ